MLPFLLSFFLVAHRGASADAPENTLPAFELAWKQGADAIEGDFHLSKDGHIVCIHDHHTERVSKKSLVVADSTLAQLQTLDVGNWKNKKFKGTRIPTLAEVLATVPEEKKIFIEVKIGPEMVKPLTKALTASSLKKEQVVVISFNQPFLKAWKTANPDCESNLLLSYNRKRWDLSPSFDETLAKLKATGVDGLSTNTHRGVNKGFVQRLHKAGYKHHVWTVDSPKTAKRFLSYGTQSITTNLPYYLRKTLDN